MKTKIKVYGKYTQQEWNKLSSAEHARIAYLFRIRGNWRQYAAEAEANYMAGVEAEYDRRMAA